MASSMRIKPVAIVLVVVAIILMNRRRHLPDPDREPSSRVHSGKPSATSCGCRSATRARRTGLASRLGISPSVESPRWGSVSWCSLPLGTRAACAGRRRPPDLQRIPAQVGVPNATVGTTAMTTDRGGFMSGMSGFRPGLKSESRGNTCQDLAPRGMLTAACGAGSFAKIARRPGGT